ncbi:MAG: fibronectin type III domain-containing protein, partial [Thermoguttaceae bacterium]|nr:fibronectin type III domain-containing protein [Thermoguttaceae bacterium]
MSIFSSKFFGGKKNSNNRRVDSRKLRLEALEERQLLDAAGMFTYDSLDAYTAVLATTGNDDPTVVLPQQESGATEQQQLATPTLSINQYVSSTKINVTIGNVDDNAEYEMQCSQHDSSSFTDNNPVPFSVPVGTNTIDLPTSIGYNQAFNFRVRAKATAEEGSYVYSDWSEPVRWGHISTPSLTVSSVSSDCSITVQIGGPGGVSGAGQGPQGYVVKYIDSDYVNGRIEKVNGTLKIVDMSVVNDDHAITIDRVSYINSQTVTLQPSTAEYTKSYYILAQARSFNNGVLDEDITSEWGVYYKEIVSPKLTLQTPTLEYVSTNYDTSNKHSITLNIASSDDNADVYKLRYRRGTSSWQTRPDITKEDLGTVTIGGLTANSTYTFEVYAINNSGDYLNSPTSTVTAKTFFTASVPLLADKDATTSKTVTLTISRNGILRSSTYELEYSDNSDFSNSKTVNLGQLFPSGVTPLVDSVDYTVADLTPGTPYRFRVRAKNSNGNYSADSQTVVIQTNEAPGQLGQPTLSIGEVVTPRMIEVVVGAVPNAASYTIEYATSPDFSDAKTMELTPDPTQLESETLSGRISGLQPETTYHLRVTATNQPGEYDPSESSEPVEQATPATTETFDMPINLAFGDVTATSIAVYVDNVDVHAALYKLEYATSADFADAEKLELITEQGPDSTLTAAGTASELDSETTYYFRVRAIARDDSFYDDTDWSPVVFDATTKARLAAPSLSVESKTGFSITVNVDAVPDAVSYTGEYATSADFSDAQSMELTPDPTQSEKLSGTASGLNPNTTYYFRVMAIASSDSGCGDSAWSELTARTDEVHVDTPILEVTNFSGTRIDYKVYGSKEYVNDREILHPVDHANQYNVQYSFKPNFTGSGGTRSQTSPGGNYVSSSDIKRGIVVYLRAWATGKDGYSDSAYYNVDYAVPLDAPTLSNVGTNSITVAFDPATSADRYVLQYDTSDNFSNPTSVDVGAGSNTISLLDSNTPYYFRVKWIVNGFYGGNQDLESAWSTVVSDRTLDPSDGVLDTPTLNLISDGVTAVSISVGVDENTIDDDAESYALQYATSDDFSDAKTIYLTDLTDLKSVSGYVVSGLDPGTEYSFRIKAIADDDNNDLGDSAWSNVLSAWTKIQLDQPTLSVDTTATTTDSVTVSVSVDGRADGYALQYAASDEEPEEDSADWITPETNDIGDAVYIIENADGTLTVSGLNSNTTYYFRVKATANSDSDFGDSDWTIGSEKTAKAPLGDPTLSFEYVLANSVTVNVEAVNATSYELAYWKWKEGTPEGVLTQSVDVTSGRATVNGLLPGTKYCFQVTATGADSESKQSEVYTATTEQKVNWLVVTTTADGIDLTDGLVSLREAIDYVNNPENYVDEDDEIEDNPEIKFAVDGTITVNSELGEFVIDKTVTINGAGSSIVLDGGNASRIITVNAEDVVLNNLTLQNAKVVAFFGDDDEDGFGAARGGALYVSTNADVELNNVDFLNNVVESANREHQHNSGGGSKYAYGGAIYNDGTLTVYGGTFDGNDASTFGGAIFNAATLTLNNASFVSNTASGTLSYRGELFHGKGGALYGDEGSITTINGGSFKQNTAYGSGGAIEVSNATLTITGTAPEVGKQFSDNPVLFEGNSAQGAGALAAYSSKVELTDVKFDGNAAVNNTPGKTAYGGAVTVADSEHNNLYGSFTDVRGVYVNNTAGSGGAIKAETLKFSVTGAYFGKNHAATTAAAIDQSRGVVEVKNSTFVANTANRYAGAIEVSGSETTLVSENCRYDNNTQLDPSNPSGSHAGAIRAGSGTIVTSTNDVFTNNAVNAREGGAIFFIGTLLSINGGTFENNGFIGDAKATLGGAIYKGGNGTLTITGTKEAPVTFSGNKASTGGGAIYNADGLTTLEGYVTFSNNTAKGGAIYVDKGTVVSNGADFDSNHGGDGGAVYVAPDGTFAVHGGSFTNNSGGSGGAIYNVGTLTVDGSPEFTRNTASSNGGAIYTTESITLKSIEFARNKGNSGGAIFIAGTSTIPATVTITDVSFDKNEASGSGGAVYIDALSALEVHAGTFLQNKATLNGGAIFSPEESTLKINQTDGDQATNFTENTANKGGAIYAAGVISVSNASFKDNVATSDGGAIYDNTTLVLDNTVSLESNDAANGGAVYVTESGSLETTDVEFKENTATNNGGAVYVESRSTFKVHGGTFDQNTAKDGGAIYSSVESSLKINQEDGDQSTSFTKNSATNDGGAIYTVGADNISNATFTDNTATRNGGGIYNNGETVVANAAFTGNDATNDGGAIYNNTTLNLDETVSFESNSAGYGGAIYVTDEGVLTTNAVSFTGNSATNDGGAIYNKNVATLTDSKLTENSAAANGGAVYNNVNAELTVMLSGNLTADETRFYKNSANNGGAIYNAGKTTFDSEINTILRFVENDAETNGGAIANVGRKAKLTTDVNLGFNKNSAANGGAIYNDAVVTLANVNATENAATLDGGAIYNAGTFTIASDDDAMELDFDNNFKTGFYKNEAARGGAIFNVGTLSVSGTDAKPLVFKENAATLLDGKNGDGGAIWNHTGGKATVSDASFANNVADRRGGAIGTFGSSLTLTDTTFDNNEAGLGGALLVSSETTISG